MIFPLIPLFSLLLTFNFFVYLSSYLIYVFFICIIISLESDHCLLLFSINLHSPENNQLLFIRSYSFVNMCIMFEFLFVVNTLFSVHISIILSQLISISSLSFPMYFSIPLLLFPTPPFNFPLIITLFPYCLFGFEVSLRNFHFFLFLHIYSQQMLLLSSIFRHPPISF